MQPDVSLEIGKASFDEDGFYYIVGRKKNMFISGGENVFPPEIESALYEIEAIREACVRLGSWRLQGCTLYVTLEPCPMCAGALGWSQIGRIVYGTSDPKRGFFSYFNPARSPIHPKTTVEGGLLEEECRQLMTDFFKKLRK